MNWKIGDTITIISPKPIHRIKGIYGRLWWNPRMDKYISATLIITGINKSDKQYSCNTRDDIEWVWIEEWLEDPILALINEVIK